MRVAKRRKELVGMVLAVACSILGPVLAALDAAPSSIAVAVGIIGGAGYVIWLSNMRRKSKPRRRREAAGDVFTWSLPPWQIDAAASPSRPRRLTLRILHAAAMGVTVAVVTFAAVYFTLFAARGDRGPLQEALRFLTRNPICWPFLLMALVIPLIVSAPVGAAFVESLRIAIASVPSPKRRRQLWVMAAFVAAASALAILGLVIHDGYGFWSYWHENHLRYNRAIEPFNLEMELKLADMQLAIALHAAWRVPFAVAMIWATLMIWLGGRHETGLPEAPRETMPPLIFGPPLQIAHLSDLHITSDDKARLLASRQAGMVRSRPSRWCTSRHPV